jgi:hypothetical protein
MSPVERTGKLEIVAHHGSCIAAASKSRSFDPRGSSRLRIGKNARQVREPSPSGAPAGNPWDSG